MRTTVSDSVNYLLIRLDYIPGLQPASKTFILKCVADKTIGIKSDRRLFLAEAPKDPTCTVITKVCTYIRMCIYTNQLKYIHMYNLTDYHPICRYIYLRNHCCFGAYAVHVSVHMPYRMLYC